MSGREVKWTQELRSILYRRITAEFGPYREWGMADYPSNRKSEYEQALRDIAHFISAMTGDQFESTAVQQQVRWGFSKQSGVNDQSRARQFILNKAAALEAVFISAKDLPKMMLIE